MIKKFQFLSIQKYIKCIKNAGFPLTNSWPWFHLKWPTIKSYVVW